MGMGGIDLYSKKKATDIPPREAIRPNLRRWRTTPTRLNQAPKEYVSFHLPSPFK